MSVQSFSIRSRQSSLGCGCPTADQPAGKEAVDCQIEYYSSSLTTT
ncbi:hypothetical protein OG762_43330 [Streptomyces sp. NBC_01136]|nr:hypothetical protein OG762_43330 [Streptomyces sp. NBC_01136]